MLPKDDAGWAPCAEGILSSTVARVRSKRRQANLLRFGASTFTGALLLVVASFYLSPNSIGLDSINRECRDVGGMLAGYVAGDLNQENRQLVQQHLVNVSATSRMRSRLLGRKTTWSPNTSSFAAASFTLAFSSSPATEPSSRWVTTFSL